MFDYVSPDRKLYQGVKITSRYLPMRDGVRLAVDVIFPQPYDFRKPLPVLLHQTRYWRRPRLRAPWRWFLSPMLGSEGQMVKELVMSGFAFVNVDARGSGASFGHRAHPWTAAEVDDGVDVLDWIVSQPWSNGSVGAVGISYTGTAAEFLATRGHPALKAVMPLFSLYDIYDDIALPGGIPHDGFVQRWGQFNAALDRNEFPLPFPIAKALLRGVAPVEGARGELQAALAEHAANLSVSDTARGIAYRDQGPANGIVERMGDFSPHRHRAAIEASGVPFFGGSGWFDGAYQHAAIKRHLSLGVDFKRLVIGAWDHGGKAHITPGHSRKYPRRLVGMPLQYFDHFLKGYDSPVTDLPAVQYHTMGEEAWKAAATWPPEGLVEAPLYLGRDHRLRKEAAAEGRAIPLREDPAQGSGDLTRWRCLLGLVTTHRYYPDRRERSRNLLGFETPPLERDLEVTGHPVVELWLKTQAADGAFFVYLDDVGPEGDMRYVTEGMLRGIHRQESASADHVDCVPQRSYLRADARPFVAGEPTLLRFDLLPTSYLFRAGRRLRISIGTGDRDNFASITPAGAEYGVLVGGEWASRVLLPIMQKSNGA